MQRGGAGGPGSEGGTTQGPAPGQHGGLGVLRVFDEDGVGAGGAEAVAVGGAPKERDGKRRTFGRLDFDVGGADVGGAV